MSKSTPTHYATMQVDQNKGEKSRIKERLKIYTLAWVTFSKKKLIRKYLISNIPIRETKHRPYLFPKRGWQEMHQKKTINHDSKTPLYHRQKNGQIDDLHQ